MLFNCFGRALGTAPPVSPSAVFAGGKPASLLTGATLIVATGLVAPASLGQPVLSRAGPPGKPGWEDLTPWQAARHRHRQKIKQPRQNTSPPCSVHTFFALPTHLLGQQAQKCSLGQDSIAHQFFTRCEVNHQGLAVKIHRFHKGYGFPRLGVKGVTRRYGDNLAH